MDDDEWLADQQRRHNQSTFARHRKSWGQLVPDPISKNRQLEIAMSVLDKQAVTAAEKEVA